MYPMPRAFRPLIMGRHGAVATNHPVATQAGLDVLRAGGNAADAAVAVALTLGVVEPHMSGLGGDGFYHVWDAAQGRGRVFNGSGAAPMQATAAHYRARGGIPLHGPLSVSVPGMYAGISLLHASCGQARRATLFGAAIEAARDGFAATHALRHFIDAQRARLPAGSHSAAIFLPDGEPPALGGVLRQEALAAALAALSEGADFAGLLARGAAAADVPLTEADLADMRAEEVDPIAVPYRGFTIAQTPPNSTGFTMLQMLRILDRFDLAALGWDSAALIHLMVEAKKRVFLDREAHGADPRGRDIPLAMLLSEARAAEHAAAIDRDHAAHLPLKPEQGTGDTTYFCTVDAAGNAVSAIQSLNSPFGSGVIAGESGVLLNNRMSYWHLEEGHPNLLTPGRRVRHTMNAPMVLKDGRPWCVIGTPGADNQVQVNTQAIVALCDFGFDPQQAVELPRWSSSQYGQPANYPHDGDDTLTIEEGLARHAPALEALGHRVKVVAPLEGPCSLEAIRILENGVRMAASDPRRDGWAGAY
ncbi:gamma-glutamyltransferase family protein [Roseomonas hellenica]|uniref:Gamma-glutamyltransferase family protein n=1 Tax=Plastoroseomonas hellenica TaxID=2687306 RepID=A0ABS5ET37_9PROT|nr:gamma-glutamyltransferase family protein [Plastoroseomonas hellenica]MBR0663447.1 gamma-glutamyltransferase family protein [Plastoroseomonas hellenica]